MVAIDVEGLKEKYRVNEPIEFSIIIKGILRSGGFPNVTITKENDAKNVIYGISFMSPLSPTAPPKYTEQILHFPRENDPQAPIHAEETGIYRLTITVNTDLGRPYEVNRRIVVE